MVSTESTSHDEVRPHRRAIELAATQYGLITREQARGCGLTDAQISYRAKVDWTRLSKAVFSLPGFSPAWQQEVMALCLRGGPSTVASHTTAGALWGLDGCDPHPIHLLARSPWVAPGVHIHRSSKLPSCDVARCGPVPCTDPSRTLLDLGAVFGLEDVEVALESALRRGMTSIPRLRWRLDSVGGRGRAGTKVLRQLLDLRDPRARPAESVLEVRFLQRLRRADVRSPVRQFQVKVSSGVRFLDFAWPTAMLAVEVGGRRWHAGPAAAQRDSVRHNELTASGWRVLYFTWADVEHRAEYVVDCVRRELGASH